MFDKLLGKKHELALRVSYAVEEDGECFHAFAPAFKGLHVDGKTREEAVSNLVEAVVVYLNSLSQNSDPLPIGPDFAVHEVVQVPQGAFLGSMTVQWPSLQMSGIS